MKLRDSIYRKTEKSAKARELGRRRIAEIQREIIDKEINKAKQEKVIVEGPRTIFLKKYKLTGDFEQSKNELQERGFSSELFEDKILQKWIDEGR